jgi:hypothetical protein
VSVCYTYIYTNFPQSQLKFLYFYLSNLVAKNINIKKKKKKKEEEKKKKEEEKKK